MKLLIVFILLSCKHCFGDKSTCWVKKNEINCAKNEYCYVRNINFCSYGFIQTFISRAIRSCRYEENLCEKDCDYVSEWKLMYGSKLKRQVRNCILSTEYDLNGDSKVIINKYGTYTGTYTKYYYVFGILFIIVSLILIAGICHRRIIVLLKLRNQSRLLNNDSNNSVEVSTITNNVHMPPPYSVIYPTNKPTCVIESNTQPPPLYAAPPAYEPKK